MTPVSRTDRLLQGFELQSHGRAAAAEAIYRQVLSEEPQNPHALLFLGVLIAQGGQTARGVELMRQALAVQPDLAPGHENLGKGLELLGQLDDAEACFSRLIALMPDYAPGYVQRARVRQALGRLEDALHDLDLALALRRDPASLLARGIVLLKLNRPHDAVAAFDEALRLDCDPVIAWYNRGLAFMGLRRLDEALADFDAVLAREDSHADALLNRGIVLEGLERPQDALDSYDRALAHDPDAIPPYLNRASLLLTRLDRPGQAAASYDALLARHPDAAIVYSCRGLMWRYRGEHEKALVDFAQAMALQPAAPEPYNNRGVVLLDLGRFDEALAAFDQAIARDPNYRVAHFHKSQHLLLLGHFREGWRLYESREKFEVPPGPQWRGEDIAGKTLFVQWEQGLGDTLMFARYAALAQARGARVVMSVQAPLLRLLHGLVPPVELLAGTALPAAYDFHVPMLSLPLLFDTVPQTIPAPIPYLQAEPERIAHWRGVIGNEGLKIGICWQGSVKGGDNSRSFPLPALAPLAALAGVRLISLQSRDGLAQLDDLPPGMTVERWADFDSGADGFVDCAAVLPSLDLVITCDTAVAHLAGAVGRPVWLALKHVPEWRWQMQRSDSPWYPAMTLFRQAAPGDWGSVFAAMAQALDADRENLAR